MRSTMEPCGDFTVVASGRVTAKNRVVWRWRGIEFLARTDHLPTAFALLFLDGTSNTTIERRRAM